VITTSRRLYDGWLELIRTSDATGTCSRQICCRCHHGTRQTTQSRWRPSLDCSSPNTSLARLGTEWSPRFRGSRLYSEWSLPKTARANRSLQLTRHIERVPALADISRSALYVVTATKPVHRLQSRTTVQNCRGHPYHSPKLRPVRAIVLEYGEGQTDTQTDRLSRPLLLSISVFCL